MYKAISTFRHPTSNFFVWATHFGLLLFSFSTGAVFGLLYLAHSLLTATKNRLHR